jgi:alpha/beta superfamily hydrolase
MDDMEPVYAFSIPSVADDLALSCRIYHPRQLEVHRARGAIIAHPYAPLGGCFDDAVVLAATETLLHEGYIVGTFNFRYD